MPTEIDLDSARQFFEDETHHLNFVGDTDRHHVVGAYAITGVDTEYVDHDFTVRKIPTRDFVLGVVAAGIDEGKLDKEHWGQDEQQILADQVVHQAGVRNGLDSVERQLSKRFTLSETGPVLKRVAYSEGLNAASAWFEEFGGDDDD